MELNGELISISRASVFLLCDLSTTYVKVSFLQNLEKLHVKYNFIDV